MIFLGEVYSPDDIINEKKKPSDLSHIPSRIKTRKEFTEGMETDFVATKIFDTFKNNKINKLILDDRPKKWKK